MLPKANFAFGNSGRGGFTLLELIAVVLIIALISGLAIARIDFVVPKYRLRGAAREVAGAIKQARAKAASSGKEVYFEADLSKSAYWLLVAFPKEPREGEEVPERRELEYRPFLQAALPEGVQFVDLIFSQSEKVAEGRARLRISPLGTSAHTIVNLKNEDGRPLAVKVNGFTGTVSYYEAYKEADEHLDDSD